MFRKAEEVTRLSISWQEEIVKDISVRQSHAMPPKFPYATHWYPKAPLRLIINGLKASNAGENCGILVVCIEER